MHRRHRRQGRTGRLTGHGHRSAAHLEQMEPVWHLLNHSRFAGRCMEEQAQCPAPFTHGRAGASLASWLPPGSGLCVSYSAVSPLSNFLASGSDCPRPGGRARGQLSWALLPPGQSPDPRPLPASLAPRSSGICYPSFWAWIFLGHSCSVATQPWHGLMDHEIFK